MACGLTPSLRAFSLTGCVPAADEGRRGVCWAPKAPPLADAVTTESVGCIRLLGRRRSLRTPGCQCDQRYKRRCRQEEDPDTHLCPGSPVPRRREPRPKGHHPGDQRATCRNHNYRFPSPHDLNSVITLCDGGLTGCVSAASVGWRGVCRERSEPPCRTRDAQARRLHTLVRPRAPSAQHASTPAPVEQRRTTPHSDYQRRTDHQCATHRI